MPRLPAARVTDKKAHAGMLITGKWNVWIGNRPASRVSDLHVCSHVGGSVLPPCAPKVLIGGRPAARLTDRSTCGCGVPDIIVTGELTVLIGDDISYEFGLASPAALAQYRQDMDALVANWAALTPAQRLAAMRDALNRQLVAAGVPAVGANSVAFPGATNGQLDFQNWNVDINQNLLNNNAATPQQIRDAGGTVYHEGRHAEQWYGMAQHQAGQPGATAQSVSNSTGMPLAVTQQAAANPIAPGSDRQAWAQTMNDSVYGGGGQYRNQTLNNVSANNNAQTYQAYRNLPEEMDAWSTGDAAAARPPPAGGP
jgi:uncharacterized Zn-binding protein involved in type VI secretion